ncbi:DUF1318 domain-containing protein, partial [Escherichia coli]|uniref:DUF1318 domain-containing protein n=1 Tax=Escherichia coli TaxID=562 RepID=UPI0025ABC8F6
DRNRSHWSTSKTPSYTKSVSWQHHPTKEIAKLAGQKLVARAKSGQYVQGINGKWLRK